MTIEHCKRCKYYLKKKRNITGQCKNCKYFNEPNTDIDLTTFSKDEKAACLELVEKMRAAKERAVLIEEARQKLFIDYNNCIDTIGVEETRKIIQEINRLLRAGLVSED